MDRGNQKFCQTALLRQSPIALFAFNISDILSQRVAAACAVLTQPVIVRGQRQYVIEYIGEFLLVFLMLFIKITVCNSCDIRCAVRKTTIGTGLWTVIPSGLDLEKPSQGQSSSLRELSKMGLMKMKKQFTEKQILTCNFKKHK